MNFASSSSVVVIFFISNRRFLFIYTLFVYICIMIGRYKKKHASRSAAALGTSKPLPSDGKRNVQSVLGTVHPTRPISGYSLGGLKIASF